MPDNRFLPYAQSQMMLLPLSLDDMVPAGHMVRVISDVIDAIDTSALLALYPGGGRSAYHPVMLLKVITYAYASGIYSSRKIAAATKESVFMLWLSGQTALDHNTINRFRSERIAPIFEEIFTEVISLLAEHGYLDLDTYFLDGTKIEANANKYSFTWKKNTERYSEALRIKVKERLREIDELNAEEDALLGDDEPDELTSKDLEEAARKIDERLKKKPKDKELSKTKKLIAKDWLPRLKNYEEQASIYGPRRKSFSKTDTDATFMRMKEDPMLNGQLKAGYNVEIGSSDQYICSYSLHQNCNDAPTMISHLTHFEKLFGKLPVRICADAGYGSEENYDFLQTEGSSAFVKYAYFHKEQKRAYKNNPFRQENMAYNPDKDCYICPAGNILDFEKVTQRKTNNGYQTSSRIYSCNNCEGCSLRSRCIHGKSSRKTITVNFRLKEFQRQAKDLLISAEGKELRHRRATDVETVFGDIKQNMKFKRFSLRGLKKVSLEWGWVALGHNMRKLQLAQVG